ncbi:hypothetical protein POM88_023287 [Heracleum sosnowskyi]|uniref:Replication factor A C-terminal domain-containing protein n=1 Tax=Heracleum sosnowskyi TaxID=360622 RepID=A0AAD8IGQ2_9APIA|nr:hypothetical protein POM88_023287 [Heracleum sosnowskyi]
MTRTYQYLKELTYNKEDSIIKVRITREWKPKNPNTGHILNKSYVIMDEQGTLFHVQLPIRQIEDYTERIIQVGKIYMISKFAIVAAGKEYRPVTGDKIINFTRNTVIQRLGNEIAIPRHGFELTTFTEARSRVGEFKTLMDVVGKLNSFTPIQSLSNDKEKLEIIIQDDNATQYFINIDHPAANKLRNSGADDQLIPAVIPRIQNPGQLMLDNVNHLTIQNLYDTKLPDGKQEIFCSTDAMVVGIVPNYGWFYTGCNLCNTSMADTVKCKKCVGKDTRPEKKYKVFMKVEDQTSNTTLLLWNKCVMDLVKVPVQHVLENDEEANPTNIPPILKNIVGRRFKFYLKITENNTIEKKEEFTVIRVQEIKHEEIRDVVVEENSQPLKSTKKKDDSSNADTDDENLNWKENSQLPIDVEKEIPNTTKIPRNATKKQAELVNIHKSGTHVDPTKRNKGSYSKKIPKYFSHEKDKKTYTIEPFPPSSDTDFQVGNQKSNNANICNEAVKNDIRMKKRKQPKKKEVVAKEFKKLSQVPVENKSATHVDTTKSNTRSYIKKIPKDFPHEKDKKTYTTVSKQIPKDFSHQKDKKTYTM